MNNECGMKTEYFECQCRHMHHIIRFWYDEKEIELSTEVFMNHYLPWWKRVLVAVKYVFGIVPKDTHYDSWILKPNDVVRLKELCEKYEFRMTVGIAKR